MVRCPPKRWNSFWCQFHKWWQSCSKPLRRQAQFNRNRILIWNYTKPKSVIIRLSCIHIVKLVCEFSFCCGIRESSDPKCWGISVVEQNERDYRNCLVPNGAVFLLFQQDPESSALLEQSSRCLGAAESVDVAAFQRSRSPFHLAGFATVFHCRLKCNYIFFWGFL